MIEDQIPEDALRRLSLREYIDNGEWLDAVRAVTRAEEDFRERKSRCGGGPSRATKGEKRKYEDSKPIVTAEHVKKQYTAKEKADYQNKMAGERNLKKEGTVSAKIIACILTVLCIRRTGRQNANRESGRNHGTTQRTRRNPTQHLSHRTHQTQHLILRMPRAHYVILRTPPDAGPHLPEITKGSPLDQFLTLVTLLTIDFMLLYQTIKFTTILLCF